MQLGDNGAEIIKIEPSEGDWARGLGPPFVGGESAYFLALNRNKKSIALNLKNPRGLQIALDLARRCDVVVENFRPGVADRLGIGYDTIEKMNPRVVYCSISALGSEGPDKDLPGTELTLQARGGVILTLGVPGEAPVRFGEEGASVATGNYAAQAIVAALFHRVRSGEGQHVKTSMLRALTHLANRAFVVDTEVDQPQRRSEEPNTGFRTKDLDISFTFSTMLAGYPAEERWREFCNRVGLGHIVNDPRFTTNRDRTQNTEALKRYYEAAFKDKSSAELVVILEELGAVYAVSNDYPTLFSHPQILENEMLMEFEHPTVGNVKTVGFAVKMLETPSQIRMPPPLLGQHTAEILKSLGYATADIKGLESQGIVKQWRG